MAENNIKESDTPLRLCFTDAKKAQACVGRLIRLRYKQKIADSEFKSLLWAFNIWLGFEKHIKEIDFEKRLEALEAINNG